MANEYTVIKTLFNAADNMVSRSDNMIDSKDITNIISDAIIHGLNTNVPQTSITPTSANPREMASPIPARIPHDASFAPIPSDFLLFFIGSYPMSIIFRDRGLLELSVPFRSLFPLRKSRGPFLSFPRACVSYLRGPAAFSP